MGASFVTDAIIQLSEVIGNPNETPAPAILQLPAPGSIERLEGQIIDGLVISTLFTVNEQELVFPLKSVAVKVTVVLPTPFNVVPLGGDCVTTIALAAVQLSKGLATPV